ncbi:uncharacterized protein LOC116289522 isoform X2 [Actinia tenebrosa]|uniref:Uncharacterized protein LOC116289522 isoform X2 n=1 Tax=Actinia tenebrosa TaxID=6105 RepID=A0A6P8HI77_ACTTE|nr:uncharacterized protein LOC116289522 isoform X2 [Actinia tenebrosa]
MELVEFCGLIIVLFSGVVNSWGDYSYRGGTISYRPNTNYPTPRVEFIYRLAFEADYVYCYSGNIGHRVTWTNSHSSPWSVTKFTYYGLLHGTFNSISSSNQISCNSFNSEEGWSEGNSSFTFRPGYNGRLLIAMTYNYGYWMRNVSRVDGNYGSMLLSATNNVSANGVFNNSSPVSTLPLTVYLNLGIPSVIKIPVEDPDGDIVRCRYASYQECYSGLCTYFPHGVLDEGNCTLSYNGGGYVNQLLPIILKLEDFPSGTTQFDSSNVLGSVDLQFVVHIKNDTAPTTAPATAVAPTTVSVGVANTTVTPALSVRIQGGGSSGLLQVLHNGVWGTVCDDDWSMTNTHVVCRQLGFAGALSYHNSGGGTGQIWLDNVQCSGSESAIQQCRHRGWGIHNCGHIEDIFVTCYRDECSNYTVLNAPDRAQGYRGIKNKCDRYITPAWYRFMGDAGTAIATSCVPVRHCGTAAPGWMTGSHPTQADGVVTRTVCFNWNTTCCPRSKSIRVKNCGEFYVYLLRGHTDCALRYCGNNTESNNTCVSSPCRNGATCTDTDYGYNCTCPYEYTGRHCETGISPCNSNPCRNRGTCQGGVGWYRCSCPYAYTGQQCQTYMYPCNSGPCRNGSTCHNYYWHNRGYYCSCPRGYTGQQCQTSK